MGLVDGAEFHFFHFFPYTDLPAGHEKHESLWVDFSNANYDPKVGHQLYNRYLSEMVLADRLRGAFPRGTGMEYWANAVNPATARARFRESLDIILHCWNDDGPQQYNGE